jgi:hypothetical protein
MPDVSACQPSLLRPHPSRMCFRALRHRDEGWSPLIQGYLDRYPFAFLSSCSTRPVTVTWWASQFPFLLRGCRVLSGSRARCSTASGVLFCQTRWLVFGSPVRSGLSTPRAMDSNRNRSFHFQILKKTGPNRCGVWTGPHRFLRLVLTGLGSDQFKTDLDWKYILYNT